MVCIKAGVGGEDGGRVTGVASRERGCKNEHVLELFSKDRIQCHCRFKGSFGMRVLGLIGLLGNRVKRLANRLSIASERLTIVAARLSMALKTGS